MKQNIYKIAIISLLFFCFAESFAQRNNTLYFMKDMPQSMLVNPTVERKYNIFIGFPVLNSVYFNADNTGFSFNNLLKDASPIESLHELDFFDTDLDIGLINFGFRVKDMYFSMDLNLKNSIQISYPGDFGKFLWEGNQNNRNLNLDNFGFDVNIYNELAFGFAKDSIDIYGRNLKIGGKAKILFGILNIETKKSEIAFKTDERTAFWNFETDILVNTSTIKPLTVEEDEYGNRGGDNSETFNNIGAGDFSATDNLGFAFDLGASYQIKDDVLLSASLIDFGFINWTSGVSNFEIKNNFEIKGVNLSNEINTSVNTDAFQEFLDTLESVSEIKETNNSYVAFLSPKIYLGATYNLVNENNANIDFGVLTRTKIEKQHFRTSLSLSANMLFAKFLSFSTSYSLMNYNYTNFGIGMGIRASVFQFYFITDNILAISYKQTRNVGMRFGFNLVFGNSKNYNKKKKNIIIEDKLKEDKLREDTDLY